MSLSSPGHRLSAPGLCENQQERLAYVHLMQSPRPVRGRPGLDRLRAEIAEDPGMS